MPVNAIMIVYMYCRAVLCTLVFGYLNEDKDDMCDCCVPMYMFKLSGLFA